MPVRVETDTTIYVPGHTPGTDGGERADLEIGFPLHGGGIEIRSGKYGSQVAVGDLRDALDRAVHIQEGAR